MPGALHQNPRRTAIRVRIEGPFETTYGLAVANRALAEALDAHSPFRLSLLATDGNRDYEPRPSDLADKPVVRRLWERSFAAGRPDVVIRNTYPPRFERSAARLGLAWLYWEDSLLPPGWAEGFDAAYDGCLAPTEWVRTVLRRSGAKLPVEIVPPAVQLDPALEEGPAADLPTAKAFRFLAVSSAFPRKGIDVLVRAFAKAFTSADDVALVLKTFPNPHNTVARQLAAIRSADPHAPEIVHLDEDISPRGLASLYRSTNVLVQPSRAEGFGLPAVEAMLRGLPVVATSATGLADFCTDETCFVVPHRWEPSESHFGIDGAEWAEPDEDVLAGILRGLASGALRNEAEKKARAAKDLVSERFSPRAVARAAEGAIDRLWERRRPLSIGFVSTYNTTCGVGTYTEYLSRPMKEAGEEVTILANRDYIPVRADAEDVVRTWIRGEGQYQAVVDEAVKRELDAVHIQFHPFNFADYRELAATLDGLTAKGVPTFVTLHTAEDTHYKEWAMPLELLASALRKCSGVLVHGEKELAQLERLGVRERVETIPHLGISFPPRDREEVARALGLEGRRIVASAGFAYWHKGFLEAIEAIGLLVPRFPEILFLVQATEKSEDEPIACVARCRERIAELGLERHVRLGSGFLREVDLARLLSAAEVVVLPYRPTPEGVSGAVRFPLACGRATVVTPERIFDDVRDAVYTIPDGTPESIAQGIAEVLDDPSLRTRLEAAAKRHVEATSAATVARLHLELYRKSRAVSGLGILGNPAVAAAAADGLPGGLPDGNPTAAQARGLESATPPPGDQ